MDSIRKIRSLRKPSRRLLGRLSSEDGMAPGKLRDIVTSLPSHLPSSRARCLRHPQYPDYPTAIWVLHALHRCQGVAGSASMTPIGRGNELELTNIQSSL